MESMRGSEAIPLPLTSMRSHPSTTWALVINHPSPVTVKPVPDDLGCSANAFVAAAAIRRAVKNARPTTLILAPSFAKTVEHVRGWFQLHIVGRINGPPSGAASWSRIALCGSTLKSGIALWGHALRPIWRQVFAVLGSKMPPTAASGRKTVAEHDHRLVAFAT
ncbi:hypothetical protein D9M70_551030 [compost metagenome]